MGGFYRGFILASLIAIPFAFNSCLFFKSKVGQKEKESTSSPSAGRTPASINGVKVAFVGDTGAKEDFQEVLNLIKRNNADLLVVLGDTDYGRGEQVWHNMVTSTLGDEPALIAFGNHDYNDSDPEVIAELGMQRLARRPDVKCEGTYGEQFTCTFRGLYFVLSSIGSGDLSRASHEQYIQTQLNKSDPSHWRFCVWHKNQRLMQVGGKSDEVGWTAYETCRSKGALIATGHEHNYSRTHLLSNMQNQVVSEKGNTMTVREGASLVWVSGLGGKSIRDQQRSGDHWASIYTSNQGAIPGVLFGTFSGNTANFEFININDQVIDKFTVIKGY